MKETMNKHLKQFDFNFYVLVSFSHACSDLQDSKEKDSKYKYLIYSTQIFPHNNINERYVTRLEFFKLHHINLYMIEDYTVGATPITRTIVDDFTGKNEMRIFQITYLYFFNKIILES